MNSKRARNLNKFEYKSGPILYWMNREIRVNDNWSLIYASEIAQKNNTFLIVTYNLDPSFLGGGLRQLMFKIQGLKEVEKVLAEKNIPFFITDGKNTEEDILNLIKKHELGAIVTDFYPLKISRNWVNNILKKINIPFFEVDSHNIVPCWIASPKQEFGAYTIRPKINKLLNEFLDDFPKIKLQSYKIEGNFKSINWDEIINKSKVDKLIGEITWIKGGESESKKVFKQFLELKFSTFAEKRNDPMENVSSDISPYLHYGMISAQRVALEIYRFDNHIKSQESFLEELIIRKELSDNFCFYNKNYDSFEGFPNWAKETLNSHRKDVRDYIYEEQFEFAKTHDELWNAAQMQMVKTGKMHGYMRMYWAKKILEWTRSPEEALKIAIYLNDKYELDGRDPNGYAGIAWSIGGLHDRAWFERSVYGKIRYMNYNGCKSKFNVKAYIEKIKNMTTSICKNY